MRHTLVEHSNRTIFLRKDEGNFFYLDFISVKISYSYEKVSFAFVAVEH